MSANAVSATFVRPADTTAYTAGDVVCNSTSAPAVLALGPAARLQGGGGLIKSATVVDAANVATKATLELWLFNVSLAAVNDNTAFAPSNTEIANLVGVIALSTAFVAKAGSGAAGNCILQSGIVDIPFKCAAGDRNLYGVLVVRNAYVPISAEAFTVNLLVVQN